MTTHRPERVAERIRGILARLLREEVRDPRIGFVTLTDVRVSADLRHATVYVSVLGDPALREDSLRALRHAVPFLRRATAREAGLRRVPELHVQPDDALERGFRVDDLLRHLHEDEAHDGDEE